MHAHACTCMHTHAHACTHMHMHAHTCTCMHTPSNADPHPVAKLDGSRRVASPRPTTRMRTTRNTESRTIYIYIYVYVYCGTSRTPVEHLSNIGQFPLAPFVGDDKDTLVKMLNTFEDNVKEATKKKRKNPRKNPKRVKRFGQSRILVSAGTYWSESRGHVFWRSRITAHWRPSTNLTDWTLF